MTAKQKAHVLAQIARARGYLECAEDGLRYATGTIMEDAALTSTATCMWKARERIEIAQNAIDGMLKEGR